MNIGIDMDGVLTDIQGFNRRHATPFFRKKFNREAADADEYDIRDIFKCPDKEFMSYWKRHLLRYAMLEPAREDAKTVTRRLREEGHELIIISKRIFSCRDDFLGKLMRIIVRNWLWRNGISSSDVVFCDYKIPKSKSTACMEKNIDVMIEDEVENIYDVATVTKVICYDATYNRECEGENICRAQGWTEVYSLIKNMGQ